MRVKAPLLIFKRGTMSKSITINIPKGYQLTLTSDEFSSGYYSYLGNPGDNPQYEGAIAASKTVRIGPFNSGRFYRITSENGNISYSLEFSGLYTKEDETNPYEYVSEIDNLDDLPTPVNGVITLDSDKSYRFTKAIDLMGNRLVGGNNTAILGTSSETASITSTGLGAGVALFTTSGTTPIQNITFRDVDTALDINGDGSQALDWLAFNIVNVPNIGTISNVNNWILYNSAFLNSKGLVFDGTSGTIGVSNSLFTGDGLAGSIFEVASTANISRRFRIIYSSFVAFSSTVAIDFDASATIPTEGFILDTVNFSGGSTYLGGLDESSNDSLFVRCVGITNTSVNGQMYMNDNSTATTVSATDTYYKISGTTLASPDNQKYSHSNNRLTCGATIERTYLIQCTLSFSSGNNNVCGFGFYDSKLGDIRTPSRTKATANSAGRAENLTMSCVVKHSEGDYIEIHGQNTSSTSNITVTDMNVVITEII